MKKYLLNALNAIQIKYGETDMLCVQLEKNSVTNAKNADTYSMRNKK
jgi:hypothetical protein